MSRIRAGEAYVAVSVDNKNLLSGLREASNRIRETSQTFAAASSNLNPTLNVSGSAAFSASLREVRREAEKAAVSAKKLSDRFVVTAGDIWNAFRGVATKLSGLLGGVGDQFDKMSLRTGLSTETLSEFAHAAAISGASVADIEGAMRSLGSSLVAAQNGSSRAAKAFSILGLDVQQIAALSPERQFEEVARAISGIVSPTERAGAAMRIFGSSGAALLPLFAEGPDGLSKLRKEARELGVSIDEETAKMGAAFVDSTTRLKAALQGVGLSLAKVLTPALIEMATAASRAFSGISGFIKENPVLTTSLLGAAGALASVTSGVYLLTNAWNLMSAAAAGASKTLAKLSAAALAHPWTALAIAVGAAIAAVVAYKKAVSNVPKFSTEAADAAEAGAAAREQDRADLQRLRTLERISARHRLTNDQIAEAARLAEQLRQKYGDVGISVDAVAGKIKGATAAQAELNERMRQARINELRGSIEAARHNESSGALEADLMDQEVGWWESVTGKKRGHTWGEWFADGFGRDGAYRMAQGTGPDAWRQILEKDEGFQKKLNAAIQKNRSQIATWEAELNALLTSSQSSTAEAAVRGADPETLASAEDAVADFIDAAAGKEKSALDRRIEQIKQRRDDLIKELRRLADPEGEVDWNDAGSVSALYARSPEARAIQNTALSVDAAAETQISKAREEERQKELAEQQRALEERQRADREAAEERRKNDKELQDALRERFEKFATPAEKLALAEADLQQALQDRAEAEKTQDSGTIAGALRRLSDAEDKFTSLKDAADSIGQNVGRSVGGSFSAWQATTAASVSFEKQSLSEERRQTNYLKNIYSVLQRQRGGAVFA